MANVGAQVSRNHGKYYGFHHISIFRQVAEFLHFWVPRGRHFEWFWGLGGLIVSIFEALKSM